ncbi:hypothetical protein AY599_04240 [Leptolyngbya valderiana BDU 20041]|nr:hypothetical protein AY599_04240 [Leptolyngbya valderiana BDU 20041]
MRTVVSSEQLYLSPGSVLRSPGTWADYVSLLKQRGDRQNPSTNEAEKNLFIAISSRKLPL